MRIIAFHQDKPRLDRIRKPQVRALRETAVKPLERRREPYPNCYSPVGLIAFCVMERLLFISSFQLLKRCDLNGQPAGYSVRVGLLGFLCMTPPQLEIDTQRCLPSAIPGIIRCLHRLQYTERAGVAHVCGWDGEVGVIDDVGKC